jgi:hypothetical protein
MRHTAIRAAVVTLIIGLAATGCADADSTKAVDNRPPTTDSKTVSLNAEEVVKALANHIPAVKPATVYTAKTDRNKLLGRPGGYTSKADWEDGRAHPRLDDEVQRGGSVEIYEDPQDATRRAKHIASVLKAAPMFGTEYHYTKGGVLLRVSGELTPEQAGKYKAALSTIG